LLTEPANPRTEPNGHDDDVPRSSGLLAQIQRAARPATIAIGRLEDPDLLDDFIDFLLLIDS